MGETYHSGERAVQDRAGAREMADRVGRGIHPTVPAAAAEFLRLQRMLVAAAIDASGRVWASVLSGPPGFVRAGDERTLEIDAWPVAGDPLGPALRDGGSIGLLAIDLATRRRMRANGRVEVRPGGLRVHTEQVYANCPKYIQVRHLHEDGPSEEDRSPVVTRAPSLSPSQHAWIAGADTFFIATTHAERGADASHRGGPPGFVHVADGCHLTFPDYAGNTMFQTLGNLEVDPRAGLLFPDFARGNTLLITGRASVLWEGEEVTRFAGAQRAVAFDVVQAIEIVGGPLQGQLVEYSPFNPR